MRQGNKAVYLCNAFSEKEIEGTSVSLIRFLKLCMVMSGPAWLFCLPSAGQRG